MKTVVGVFSEVGEAQRTIDELMRLGFGAKDISVVAGPSAQRSMRLSMAPVEAADAGSLVACGPLADVMRGAGRGALTGSLRYFGLSPELAAHYTNAVRKGETLESLVVEDKDAERVVEVMSRHAARNGELVEKREKATIGAIPPPAPAPIPKKEVAPIPRQTLGRDEEHKIPIIREELRVGKREVERGHVHVSVHVAERPVSERISLREEHVDVERRPVSRAPRADEIGFKDRDLDITEYAEEPVVSKEVRVVEEVVVHKRVTGHDEVISDKVRSTEVAVGEQLKDRNVYRKHFESLGGGGSFDEHVPAYDLGRSLRTGSSGGRWEDVEPTARQRWEAHKPGTWERFKESIRYAWHNALGR